MKKIFVLGLALLVASLAIVGVVSAYSGHSPVERGSFHEQMEPILDSGSFQELESFREANDGFGGPRWVVDEDSFNAWASMHSEYESQGMEGPISEAPRRGLHRGSGNSQRGFSGDCPFME